MTRWVMAAMAALVLVGCGGTGPDEPTACIEDGMYDHLHFRTRDGERICMPESEIGTRVVCVADYPEWWDTDSGQVANCTDDEHKAIVLTPCSRDGVDGHCVNLRCLSDAEYAECV